jgi:hypothetical protein
MLKNSLQSSFFYFKIIFMKTIYIILFALVVPTTAWANHQNLRELASINGALSEAEKSMLNNPPDTLELLATYVGNGAPATKQIVSINGTPQEVLYIPGTTSTPGTYIHLDGSTSVAPTVTPYQLTLGYGYVLQTSGTAKITDPQGNIVAQDPDLTNVRQMEIIGNKMYISSSIGTVSVIFALDLPGSATQNLNAQNAIPLPYQPTSVGISQYNGELYCAVLKTTNPADKVTEVYKLDPTNNSWTLITTFADETNGIGYAVTGFDIQEDPNNPNTPVFHLTQSTNNTSNPIYGIQVKSKTQSGPEKKMWSIAGNTNGLPTTGFNMRKMESIPDTTTGENIFVLSVDLPAINGNGVQFLLKEVIPVEIDSISNMPSEVGAGFVVTPQLSDFHTSHGTAVDWEFKSDIANGFVTTNNNKSCFITATSNNVPRQVRVAEHDNNGNLRWGPWFDFDLNYLAPAPTITLPNPSLVILDGSANPTYQPAVNTIPSNFPVNDLDLNNPIFQSPEIANYSFDLANNTVTLSNPASISNAELTFQHTTTGQYFTLQISEALIDDGGSSTNFNLISVDPNITTPQAFGDEVIAYSHSDNQPMIGAVELQFTQGANTVYFDLDGEPNNSTPVTLQLGLNHLTKKVKPQELADAGFINNSMTTITVKFDGNTISSVTNIITGIPEISNLSYEVTVLGNPISKGENTTVSITASTPEAVDLFLIDIQGRLIRKISNCNVQRGENQIILPTSGLSSGNYVLRIRTKEGNQSLILTVK